ncbi:hypothetical protein BATDEDRAFT_15558 [Batrachochytrium dendrobatidis JAM81]|uniref:NADH-cytochrome b5 reductase n=2 Tax=Batrachochytrium dendrobatidis TaxID=109871 RepID=F4NS38_BATDJ|nr:uncharacterized protein BATDEDRAFT_15558 [Batrachochytrium dendrobatidis JAM81]EGF83391.1 hypothetical protein BATDEDRAFT_15558 [Batrachochytrium dendrobatidis JAM81]KAJ8326850.1 hypothetical protein O5D80_004286 [Batrachochytrium dendrobatidis]KAK5668352.1 hypothetical protein QVD99_005379 [Batrachochytrium dendrobatidis]OAJ36917.1 hypothetical protein BDEG_21017 [Batrachochytrium dendrobatidis JEL423]|eukprot:XP_006675128.1 hypothetical protein BATDEDRAFT_15558 [Batrachochytrium dendrobatidis JAM81]
MMRIRSLQSRCFPSTPGALASSVFSNNLIRSGCRPFTTAPTTSSAPPPNPASNSRGPFFWMLLLGVPAAGAGYYYSTQCCGSKLSPKQIAWKEAPVAALDPTTFKPFTVREIVDVNHNTKILRFALPEEATELGLKAASCCTTKFVKGLKEDGKPDVVIRPYTPLEDPAKGYTGYFDMLVKKYPDGVMSSYLHSRQVGDVVEIKGPFSKFEYKANEFKHIGMVAGGSGITPMVQVIQKILSDPTDKTKVSLIFANVTEDDIPLRPYLDKLAKEHPGQINVFHTLDKPPAGWQQGSGYVSEDMLKKHMPAPGQGKVYFCGNPGMMKFITGPKTKDNKQGELSGLLKKLGYTEGDVFKF